MRRPHLEKGQGRRRTRAINRNVMRIQGPVMENLMERKIEHEVESGAI